jgi:hypothetical protein
MRSQFQRKFNIRFVDKYCHNDWMMEKVGRVVGFGRIKLENSKLKKK